MKDDKLIDLLQGEKTEHQRDDDEDDDDEDDGCDDKTKMKTKVEEEEVVCPSFRNFAVENSNSANRRNHEGDPNFEFVRDDCQMDVSTSSSAYPVFGYDRLENKRSPEFPPIDIAKKKVDDYRFPITSPSRFEKSKSIGFSSTTGRKKWSLRDLIFGKSRSEAKESDLMIYTPPSPPPTLTTQKKKGRGGGERRRLTFQPNQSKELMPEPASKSHRK